MSGGGERFQPSFDTCNEVSPLCPVEATTYGDYFTLAPCVIYTVIFTLCLMWQLYIGIKHRTWSFTIFLGIGTAFELMGYTARISMSPIGTVWSYSAFVIQLLMLILGPTLVAAAISVTFKWIVVQCGPKYSVLRPVFLPYLFVGTDFLSIVIQAIGGAISASATDGDIPDFAKLDVGNGLLIAGTAFQAANMAFCGGLMIIYWLRWRKGHARGEATTTGPEAGLASSTLARQEAETSRRWPFTNFQTYIYAITVAYVAILIRCIYRIPEMALGWGSTLMQNETLFLIFDGMMLIIAVLCLTIVHPAVFFPILRKPKRSARKPEAAPSTETPPATQ